MFDLPAGTYALKIDDQQVAAGNARQWADGIAIPAGPEFDQAEQLRQTILAKNELYFHRWRPQNVTYLFGFRKHEQGNNAVEIPQFDPLVEAREAEIRTLSRARRTRLPTGQGGRVNDDASTSDLVCAYSAAGVRPLLLGPAPALAQRELKVIPDPDPELERQTFQLADGLEVNLYAADPLLAKPIHINFDAQGRLWVASSEVYPHVKPGQDANDKILVLEDTDGDGSAEKTTVFADGLLIPTGVVPGDGGAYVANSTEMLHLTDTDGDGQADRSRVMLSGFGTEDTHHIIHTFRWGPDGMLYFNQSIYIHSHIETPWGVRRLNSGGIWQFRPETMQLEVFARGLCNPWGHASTSWGQSFATDGAGGEGINYVFPGVVMFTYAGAKRSLAGTQSRQPQALRPGSHQRPPLSRTIGRGAWSPTTFAPIASAASR